MKASQINTYGAPEVIQINPNAPLPAPEAGQVLVEIHSASLNPFDVKVLTGQTKSYMPLTFPATLGGDFSGVVQDIKGESNFKKGDQIFGSASIANGGSGAFAEFATANISNTALKPKSIDFTHAAALVLVGASAVQALEDHIGLKAGQKILIQGGAGGIGHIAVQLAKALGAYVAATAGAEDVGFVKSLGADQVIDYKNQRFEDMVNDFDAVFDTVGGEVVNRSFKVLKKGGVLVSMLGQPDPILAKQHEATAIGQATKTNTAHLMRIGEWAEKGAVKVNIDKLFQFDQIKEAFQYSEEQSPRGKVVLQMKR